MLEWLMQKKENRVSRSYVIGVIALVFMIIGYQTALFVHKAAVAVIVSNRDSPDTVYVMDKGLAETVMGRSGGEANVGVPDNTEKVVIKMEAEHAPEARRIAAGGRQAQLFRFDPNTVSVEELQLLGFSSKQAVSIDNYRKKGGRFRRKSDFAKSFVVSDDMYGRLEPFIDIPLLDLNLADSAAFDALPGIGGYFAAKMVAYRAELGGSYSYKEQLMDIYHFDSDRFEALQDLVSVSPENIRPYPLWTLPEDSLRLHPYIGSYGAHGIVVFRENNPPENWTVGALSSAGILKPDLADKLARCVIETPQGADTEN